MNFGEVIKVLGTIIVAAITSFGGTYFTYKKFVIERQDAKEEKNTQMLIDKAIEKAKEDMRKEIKEAVQQGIVDCGVIGDKAIREVQEDIVRKLEDGLKARGEEGRERFEINSKQIQENSKQLSENSRQIEELIGVVKNQAESNNEKFNALADTLASLNKVIGISAESQANSNYDRLLIVTNKVLKSGKMTISDKTNLNQLYGSWKDLGGKDAKMDTLVEECMKITPTLDDNM